MKTLEEVLQMPDMKLERPVHRAIYRAWLDTPSA